MRPVLIAVAAAITIAILIWRKPECFAAIIVGAILSVFLSWRHMFDAYDEVEVVARAISVEK
jgi:hypothetical protein